ncbi:unnamed protein product, partial [Prorocentrum cordatum]
RSARPRLRNRQKHRAGMIHSIEQGPAQQAQKRQQTRNTAEDPVSAGTKTCPTETSEKARLRA